MGRPRSHPAFRKRGTLKQEPQTQAPEPAAEAIERSERWIRELDHAMSMSAKQTFIGKVFVGSD